MFYIFLEKSVVFLSGAIIFALPLKWSPFPTWIQMQIWKEKLSCTSARISLNTSNYSICVILQESICSKFKQAKNLLLKTGLKLKTEKESRIAAERNLFVGFKPNKNNCTSFHVKTQRYLHYVAFLKWRKKAANITWRLFIPWLSIR